jgi:hypothetical protein
MIDWINALLRAIMCLGFLIFVVKPMLLVFSRREFNHMELEDAAQSSVNSAFQAWRINHGKHYYDNPEYAEMMASNPNLELPDLSKPPEQLPPPEVKAEDSSEMINAGTNEILPADPATEAVQTSEAALDSTNQALEKSDSKTEGDDTTLSSTEDEEGMDEMKAKLAQEKKKKKSQSIPPELLNNANSFDDKLMVVRLITEQDQGRVAAVLRKMIQGGT